MALIPFGRNMGSLLVSYVKLAVSRRSSRRRHLAEMPNWALGLIGGYSLVAAWYWSIGVAEVGPGYVKAINVAAHLSPMAIATGVMLFLCGFQVWFYGTIAARCSKLLTDRTFK